MENNWGKKKVRVSVTPKSPFRNPQVTVVACVHVFLQSTVQTLPLKLNVTAAFTEQIDPYPIEHQVSALASDLSMDCQ